jgi:hypothetical protein
MMEGRGNASTMLAAMLLAYCVEQDDFLERYVVTIRLTSRNESKNTDN